jgi:hypothetical protein
MEGTNFVELVGKIVYPDLKTVGNGHKLFKAKLAIPLDNDKFQYLKIAGWNNIAEALSSLPEETFIRLHGHIEERSYDGKCKGCQAVEKKYWTEVIVDNFAKAE